MFLFVVINAYILPIDIITRFNFQLSLIFTIASLLDLNHLIIAPFSVVHVPSRCLTLIYLLGACFKVYLVQCGFTLKSNCDYNYSYVHQPYFIQRRSASYMFFLLTFRTFLGSKDEHLFLLFMINFSYLLLCNGDLVTVLRFLVSSISSYSYQWIRSSYDVVGFLSR